MEGVSTNVTAGGAAAAGALTRLLDALNLENASRRLSSKIGIDVRPRQTLAVSHTGLLVPSENGVWTVSSSSAAVGSSVGTPSPSSATQATTDNAHPRTASESVHDAEVAHRRRPT